MKKKSMVLLMALGILALGIGITFLLKPGSSRKITFEACTQAGGTAWRVDIFSPDLCPACAEYGACQQQNQGAQDIEAVCPQAAACAQCMENNFPYPDHCPQGREKLGEISDAATWFLCCK